MKVYGALGAITLCALIGGFFVGLVEDEMTKKFEQHIGIYGHSYATKEEYEFRKSLFAKTDAFITEWNSNTSATHKVGHNKFSDMSDDEYKRSLGYKGPF